MACWREDNKALSHKIASLETKLFEALSKEGNGNKSQGQDNGGMDWLDLDPLQVYHPHHLDFPPTMKEIPAAPLPNAPPSQDFSKLGLIYITVLGLANQVVPHTGGWCPLATAVNYLVHIACIVYMAFQARPASSMGAQSDSDMGRDSMSTISKLVTPGPYFSLIIGASFMLLFLTSTYYLRHYMTKKQEINKSQEEIVSKLSLVQTMSISTSNQSTAASTTFPDLLKMDLAGFRKGMIMINALFHAHPRASETILIRL
ncbi:hypothetical protein DSO57_1031080 [Entomophthora muscae]|uniref:Uncharacterized protein n=1 Tax=Entomophthora muscae TaxID=34485 RepID=A0ACC2U9S0_9FUNG|nr:hypothetical protein DSO57_1031080 [Entomophthora muscae]